jgi:hypothetical protein
MQPFLTREMLDGMDHFWRMRSWLDLQALPPERKTKCCPSSASGPKAPPPSTARTSSRPTARPTPPRRHRGRQRAVRLRALARRAQPARIRARPAPTNDPLRPLEHIAFTVPFNMSEQPAASINCGYSAACPSACRSPGAASTTWA